MEDQNVVSPAPQNSNRVWIIAGIVIFLCCCLVVVTALATIIITRTSRNSVGTSGGVYSGLADDLLKRDALNAIAQYETAQTDCTDISLFSGSATTHPDPSLGGFWFEEWQVNVCGEIHLYSVVFTPAVGGGTDFSIERIDQ